MSSTLLKKALQKESELELTVKGRRSGKDLPRLVWFVVEGDKVLLLPVNGSRTNWYKNILENSKIKLGKAGKTLRANAKPITDSKGVRAVVQLFNQKYGEREIKKWYRGLDVAVEIPIT